MEVRHNDQPLLIFLQMDLVNVSLCTALLTVTTLLGKVFGSTNNNTISLREYACILRLLKMVES